MSRGNDLRQHSLQRQAQHQRQFDATSRHMRETARAADQGFQARSRARTEQAAKMGQQQFQASRRRQMDQARQIGQQHFQPWRGDSDRSYYEPVKSPSALRSVLVFAIQYILFFVWLFWMVWVIVGK